MRPATGGDGLLLAAGGPSRTSLAPLRALFARVAGPRAARDGQEHPPCRLPAGPEELARRSSAAPEARRPLLGLLAAVALGACGSSSSTTTSAVCTPACPSGTVCTDTGCVAQNPVDLAAPHADQGGGDKCGGNCGGATPRCSPAGTCVACLDNSDCPPGAVCKASGAITVCAPGCDSDSRCRGDGGGGGACCGGGCTDLASDALNCGACGAACSVAHATSSCRGGSCALGACDPQWGDCNHNAADGCETNLHVDTANCGACGKTCKLPSARAACADGSCYVAACLFGFDDCNGNAADGCETDVTADARNCGACGNTCINPPHAKAGCVNAACQLTVCDQGFADCDGNPGNGCEVAVGIDPRNCGACGNQCGQGLVCKSGGCTCPQCNIPNAKSKCVANVCVIDICLPGWGDCNNNPKDGCEADLTSDPKNCGACNNACPNNAPFCYQSMCSVFSLFPQANYDAAITFQDQLGGTTMTITYDGTEYWSTSGGGPQGDRLAEYDSNGAALKKYQPNIDFRSVFTVKGKNTPVYSRGFNSNSIQSMGNPGVFANAITLNGGAIDAQSAVVWDDTGKELIAFNAGTVSRFDDQGAFIATLALQGFGTMNQENQYPQNRGIAKAHGYYLTYAAGVLSAWDDKGARAKTTILNKAGTSFDSYFSFSYANGKVFVVDRAGGTWRGYDVGL